MGAFPQLRPPGQSGAVTLAANTAIPDTSPYLVLSQTVTLPPSGRGWLVWLSPVAQVSASGTDILSSYPKIDLPDGSSVQRGAEETYANGTNRAHGAPAISAYIDAAGGPVTFSLTLTSGSALLTAIAEVGGSKATVLDWSAIPLD